MQQCRICSVTTQSPVFLSCPCHPLPLSHTIVTMLRTQYCGVVDRVLVTHQPFLGSTLSTRLGTVFFSVVPISIPSRKDTNGWLSVPKAPLLTVGTMIDVSAWLHPSAHEMLSSLAKPVLYSTLPIAFLNLSCYVSYWFLDRIFPQSQ